MSRAFHLPDRFRHRRSHPRRGPGLRVLGVAVAVAAALSISVLSGCSSIGGLAGAASGIAVGGVSANPAVGIGVGIAVKAATDTAMNNVFRNMQQKEQDEIANFAGSAPLNERQAWKIHHWIPFNDEHGEFQAVSELDNALATCRNVMFSVIGGKKKAPTEQWFSAQTCRQSDGQWKWATAEPAVDRWGNLQ